MHLFALQTGVLTIINSSVAHSVATTAGMVAAEGHSSVHIMGSTLHDNRASAGAGGAFFLAVQWKCGVVTMAETSATSPVLAVSFRGTAVTGLGTAIG